MVIAAVMLEKYGELDRALEYAELGSVIDAATIDVETNVLCNMLKGRILAGRQQPDRAAACLELAASTAERVGMLYASTCSAGQPPRECFQVQPLTGGAVSLCEQPVPASCVTRPERARAHSAGVRQRWPSAMALTQGLSLACSKYLLTSAHTPPRHMMCTVCADESTKSTRRWAVCCYGLLRMVRRSQTVVDPHQSPRVIYPHLCCARRCVDGCSVG
jgi:hypothetical protein